MMRGGLFQSYEMRDFYASTGFLEPFCFESRDGGVLKARIVGYIQSDGGPLRRFFSRRAIVNAGPLLSESCTPEELGSLLDLCVKKLRGKAIYLEFRNFYDYSDVCPVFESRGFEYRPHYDFWVDTSSPEIVESKMGKNRRRYIRQSFREGVVLDENPSEERIAEYYTLLERLYRTKVKTPLFPLPFFLNLSKTGFGRIILVIFQEKVVGGVVLASGDGAVYEWFVCGEDGIYNHVYPSSVATRAGMDFAVHNSFQCFDMMGAGAPGDGGYGVRDFKAEFGGELKEFGRFVKVLNRPLYTIGALGVKMLKKLK